MTDRADRAAEAYRDILVGIDDSPASARALDHAVSLARAANARVTILAAVEPPSRLAYATPDAEGAVLAHVALEHIARERAALAAAGVPGDVGVTTLVTREPAREALLSRVAGGHHDLVVLGAGRRGRVRGVLRKDAGAWIARRSDVPVLVVAES